MSQPTDRTSPDALRAWLSARLAEYLDVAPADISPTVALAEYGMDSVYVFALASDIAQEYGLTVEPTVAWDHNTVDALAVHLSGELTRSRSAA